MKKLLAGLIWCIVLIFILILSIQSCEFITCILQDPNADTEWNDVLRAKGILPPKETLEVTEQDLINMVEAAIEQKSRGNCCICVKVSSEW